MIAGALRWTLYFGIAAIACLVLSFVFVLAINGFFLGLFSSQQGHFGQPHLVVKPAPNDGVKPAPTVSVLLTHYPHVRVSE
jgi:hypothetical protein